MADTKENEILKFLDTIDFECQRCSACCRYDPGAVFLTEEDIRKICKFLSTDRDTLLNKYCRGIFRGGKLVVSLLEKKNFDCIFWDNGCKIYEARPIQCITYPFWSSLVESKRSWYEESKRCKGINKKSKLKLEDKYNYYKLEKESNIIEMDFK